MPRMQRLTPMLLVSNLEASLQFFGDVLGFDTPYVMSEYRYAYIACEGVAVRLFEASPDIDLQDEARQVHCYIDVEDLDGLYAELKPELDKLPKGRVRPPFDTEYGQREFHVTDADTLLISFGETIGKD